MGRAYLPEQWARNPAASMPVKALSAVLSSYANGESGDQDVWPSPETVAAALGISARHVQNLSAEGEGLKWWTRIHERTRTGGVMLTWRLHLPEISANRSPTEHERNHSSVGENHYALPNGSRTEAERKPNGSRTEAERNHSSDGRVEGYKGIREEGKKNTDAAPQAEPQSLDLKPQKLKPDKPKGPPIHITTALAIIDLWNKHMAPIGNARAIPDKDTLARNARNLYTVALRLGNVYLVGRLLKAVAAPINELNWLAGRPLDNGKKRVWLIGEWFATANVAKALAELEAIDREVGKQPPWDFSLERKELLPEPDSESPVVAPAPAAAPATTKPPLKLVVDVPLDDDEEAYRRVNPLPTWPTEPEAEEVSA